MTEIAGPAETGGYCDTLAAVAFHGSGLDVVDASREWHFDVLPIGHHTDSDTG